MQFFFSLLTAERTGSEDRRLQIAAKERPRPSRSTAACTSTKLTTSPKLTSRTTLSTAKRYETINITCIITSTIFPYNMGYSSTSGSNEVYYLELRSSRKLLKTLRCRYKKAIPKNVALITNHIDF